MTTQPQTPLERYGGTTFKPETFRLLAIVLGVMAVTTTLAAIGAIFLVATQFSWQYLVLAGSFVLASLAGFDGLNRSSKGTYTYLWLALPTNALVIALLLTSILIAKTALPAAILFLLFSLMETSITYSGLTRGTFTIVLGLVFSILVASLGTFITQYQIPLAGIDLMFPGLFSVAALIYLVMLGFRLISAPLQIRLTVGFLAILIIPLTITSVIQNQATLDRIRNETYNGLSATSNQVALVLDKFINNNKEAIRQEADLDALSIYLSDSTQPNADRNMQTAINLLATRETDERKALSSYALLDGTGSNLYDTDHNAIGKLENESDYFLQPLQTGKPYSSPVIFDGKGSGFIYFSAPVKSVDRAHIIGVLRAKYSQSVFQRILVNYSGLFGIDSYAMIVDENMLRLADSFQPGLTNTSLENFSNEKMVQLQAQNRLPIAGQNPARSVSTELVSLLRSNKLDGAASLDLQDSSQVKTSLPEIMAYSTMNEMPWKIIYLKANYDQRPVENQQTQTVILIASIAALMTGLISIEVSRVLANPIINLTRTAEKISAGDLTVRAENTGDDEIGTLANGFNLMTDQLESSIRDLEKRVSERTLELEHRNKTLNYRSNQLQTVAEVARGIVTSQELLPLLESVTQLISSRFGFYHVGIFLLDDNREFAVLLAANSEGGKRMLSRNHRLEVGRKGIVGYVTGTGQPRVTTDVGEDAVFYNNPDLPLTRSEMALPLRIADEIIGALDVQSVVSNAFTRNDIELFSTLADQVAVAIFNNRLYNETARALAESQAIHRQYLRQEWTTEIATRRNRAFRYTPQGVGPDDSAMAAEDSAATGVPESISEPQPDGTTKVGLLVPIFLRGEMIGTIRVQDQGEERAWTENELLAVQDVAGQVGVALETARLFEKTTLRAERERKVLEITGQIRASNDPQKMLEIAATELQKALGVTRAQIYVRPMGQPDQHEVHPNGGHPTKEG